MPGRPPRRLVWAVERLDVQPDHQLLEIGCGRGVAAALICERLGGGRLLAIDRSATAIAAATARNAEQIAAGTARFSQTALEELDPAGLVPPVLAPRDAVLAVNVNLFWTRSAQPELQLIAGLLAPEGRLLLVYDPPDSTRLVRLEATLRDHLGQAGYLCSSAAESIDGSTLLAVTARPAATGSVREAGSAGSP